MSHSNGSWTALLEGRDPHTGTDSKTVRCRHTEGESSPEYMHLLFPLHEQLHPRAKIAGNTGASDFTYAPWLFSLTSCLFVCLPVFNSQCLPMQSWKSSNSKINSTKYTHRCNCSGLLKCAREAQASQEEAINSKKRDTLQ